MLPKEDRRQAPGPIIIHLVALPATAGLLAEELVLIRRPVRRVVFRDADPHAARRCSSLVAAGDRYGAAPDQDDAGDEQQDGDADEVARHRRPPWFAGNVGREGVIGPPSWADDVTPRQKPQPDPTG
jgi:hypothetical protein